MLAAISELLQCYELDQARVQLVARSDCDVYRIRLPQGRVEDDLSLRVYPDHRDDLTAIEAEMAWLLALESEGLFVPRPVPDRNGHFICALQRCPSAAPRHAVVLTWLHGRRHERGLTPARLRRVGVFVGRMHSVAARLERSGILQTRRLAFTPDIGAWASGLRSGLRSLSPGLAALAPDVARRIRRELDSIPCDPTSYGFVHADLHPWNLLFARDVAGAIDFSDCGWGHLALDLATALQYLKFPLAGHVDHSRRYPELRAQLLEGYAHVQTLPPDIEAQVDTYLIARLFSTLEWMLDDWPSLHHRSWGPAFQRTCQQAFRRYLS